MNDRIHCPDGGTELSTGQSEGVCVCGVLKAAQHPEKSVHGWCRRKPAIVLISTAAVLFGWVGLSCRVGAQERESAAGESGKKSREQEPFDYQRATQVSVEFGETNRESGLYVVEVGDSRHTPAMADGQPAWFFSGGWNYAYFLIDPAFKPNLGSDVVIRAEYQILGRNPIGLQYDGVRGPYSSSVEVQREFKESNSHWRIIEFRARDARFQNSQNRRADFRLYDNEKGFYLRRVTLGRYPGRRIPPRDPSTSSNLVDLTAFYNASLRIYMPAGDPDAATNVLRAVREATGVEFDARGYVGLYRRGEDSSATNGSPDSVAGIPIGRRLSGLHFLHAASYGESTGRAIGSYVMHLSDGSRRELAIVYGRNVCSERGDYRKLEEADVAWEGEGIRTGAGTRVRIFKTTWVNPDPALAVTSLDFVSTRSGSAPHLLAITIEP